MQRAAGHHRPRARAREALLSRLLVWRAIFALAIPNMPRYHIVIVNQYPRLLLVAVSLLCSVSAFGVQTQFDIRPIHPAQPASDLPVTARLLINACVELTPESFTTVVTGNTIEIRHTIPNCPILPIGDSAEVDLGLLPPGTYTARLVDAGNLDDVTVDDTTTFTVAAPAPGCVPGGFVACALNDRFRVTVRYREQFNDFPALTEARVTRVDALSSPTLDTMLFYLTETQNIEVLVKLFDRGNRDASGNLTIAVLYGVATPLRTEILVTDTTTNITRRYISEYGASQGGSDFTAFVK